MKPFIPNHIISNFTNVIKKRPLLSICIGLSILIHISLFALSNKTQAFKHTPLRQKMVVKTHFVHDNRFQEREKLLQKASPSSKNHKTAISTKPQNSKTSKRQETPKKSKSLTNDQAKKLLSDLQQSLAQIETTKEKKGDSKDLFIPQSIKELKTDLCEITSDSQNAQGAYEDVLIDYLKSHLQLPAYGKVKILLTLNSKGELEDLEIVFSDSEINRFYLEKNIKGLHFPQFSHELIGQKNFTFNLTFSSD